MSLINRETLYEKACDLEAQALAYVGKIVNDETKIEEWKIWSAILVERTAFKHDIFDAPSVQPEVLACGSGELNVQSEPQWIPCSERLPEHGGWYIVTKNLTDDGDKAVCLTWYSFHGWEWGEAPIAWMPLPDPYQEEGDSE